MFQASTTCIVLVALERNLLYIENCRRCVSFLVDPLMSASPRI